jgi:hypothetical protein
MLLCWHYSNVCIIAFYLVIFENNVDEVESLFSRGNYSFHNATRGVHIRDQIIVCTPCSSLRCSLVAGDSQPV